MGRRVIPESLVLPPRTLSGPGVARDILCECSDFGSRGILVHGHSLERSGVAAEVLGRCPAGMRVKAWVHPGGEPTLEQLEALLAVAREHGADWVAAVGGGSVLDVAKACAGLLDAPLRPVAYHDGADIRAARVPFVAAPTTAGTGSESTTVSVLINAETGVKKSIRHASFMPRLIVLDPCLLASCPPNVTAWSGMDAFTQAVESFVSAKSCWVTDQFALEAVGLIDSSLEDVFRDARCEKGADLMAGSYLAGVALSNARLGLVHGLAHPLGSRYHVAHGLVCAVCLPVVLEFNKEAIGAKYELLGARLREDPLCRARHLLASLRIESPFAGRAVDDVAGIVEETLASGSTTANPRPVTARDVEDVVGKLFAASACVPGEG